eukprot:TRINITY_DN13544_c0_g1_i3.p1 TRINITY_DN13544_c0_g1~~TRINITY_DN13544_c0_g1_i3.p1  ORF type:complete len:613 (+),score=105.98 TRINITY_DN13544_c0_g1_i3:68-1906(+)
MDWRAKSAKLQTVFTNSYWNVPRGMLRGAPPPTTTETISREIATPAVEEFLAGSDVCFTTFGARVSGKTHVLFGQPLERKPSCSILSSFIEGVFEAFGGEVQNENQVMISALEILPDGTALNLLDGAAPVSSFNESFEAAIPGWNPIWELICVIFEKLEGLRAEGGDRGTTLVSFRVQRRDACNVDNCPLAVFMESEPISSSSPNSLLQSEVRKMANDEALKPNNPWAINLILEVLQGRVWSTRLIACVSPSPTALQASLTVMGLVSKFNPKCLNNTNDTPKREVKGVLAFSPDEMPVPKTEVPTPTVPAPALGSVSVAQLLQTPSAVSDNTAIETTPGASASQVSESVCTELIGLVKLLKGEVETLRGELADERRRNSAAERRLSDETEIHELKTRNKSLERECHERTLQLEVVAGEKRNIERELRIIEQNQVYGNLYDDVGSFAKRSSSVTRGRTRGASKSPLALKKNQLESGDQRYSRQGTAISNMSDSKIIKKRSSTPPSAIRTVLRSTSGNRTAGRRSSLTTTAVSKATTGSRVPSLVSDATTPSGASSPRAPRMSMQTSTQVVKDKSHWVRQTNRLHHPFKSVTPTTPQRATRQFTLTKTPTYTTI